MPKYKKKRRWINNKIGATLADFKVRAEYGNIDSFLKRLLKLRNIHFAGTNRNDPLPECIIVSRNRYSVQFCIPYDHSGTFIRDIDFEHIKKKLHEGTYISGYSRRMYRFHAEVLTTLHGLITRNEIDEAFDFMTSILNEYSN